MKDMHDDEFDRGLQHDLKTMSRRGLLRWIGGAGLFGLAAGCVDRNMASVDPDAPTGTGSCAVITEETQGPYPGDGSNGANALSQSGIVRADIRSSVGTASGVATGVPLTVRLKLVNTKSSCAALAGYAIYIWHCDALGRYSMYSSGVTAENYLRGVQVTDASGEVSFTTVIPVCYPGRWPHIHFEIYPAVPTSSTTKLKTSQLAIPEATCRAVYATSGYTNSLSSLNGISLSSDNVFSDGVANQLPDVTGDTSSGYVAVLNVGINV